MKRQEFAERASKHPHDVPLIGRGKQFEVYSHPQFPFVYIVPKSSFDAEQEKEAFEGYELGRTYLGGLVQPFSLITLDNFTREDGSEYHGKVIVQQKGLVFPDHIKKKVSVHGPQSAEPELSQLVLNDRSILARGLLTRSITLDNYLVSEGQVLLGDLGDLYVGLDKESDKSDALYIPRVREERKQRLNKRGYGQYMRLVEFSQIDGGLADVYKRLSGLPFEIDTPIPFHRDDIAKVADDIIFYLSHFTTFTKAQLRDKVGTLETMLQGKYHSDIQEMTVRAKYAAEFEALGKFELKALAPTILGKRLRSYIESDNPNGQITVSLSSQ